MRGSLRRKQNFLQSEKYVSEGLRVLRYRRNFMPAVNTHAW